MDEDEYRRRKESEMNFITCDEGMLNAESSALLLYLLRNHKHIVYSQLPVLGRASDYVSIFPLLILIFSFAFSTLDFPPYSFSLMYERANFYDLIPDVNIVVAHSKWQEEDGRIRENEGGKWGNEDPKSTGAAMPLNLVKMKWNERIKFTFPVIDYTLVVI